MKRLVEFAVLLLLISMIGCGTVPSNAVTPGETASGVRSPSTAPTPSSVCASPAPPRRADAAAAYDSARRVTVMFGGVASATNTLNETWLFDGACWRQAHPTTSPAPRRLAGMAYDPVIGRSLLIGGRSQPPVQPDYPEDAWSWDGNNWTLLTDAPRLDFPVASFDAARGVIVIFGWGPASIPETWTWDGSTWAKKSSPNSPSVYAMSGICFDQATRSVILYGGVSQQIAGGVSSETWLWNGTAWSKANTAHAPGPRAAPVVTCGPQTLLFGGLTSQQANVASDTWAWNGLDWQSVATTSSPQDCCGVGVFDGNRQLVLDTVRDGTPVWQWTGSDWGKVS